MLHSSMPIEIRRAGNRIVSYKTRAEKNKARKINEEIKASSNASGDYSRGTEPTVALINVSEIRESKVEIVEHALGIVCNELRVQTAAIFLFSKNGNLERIGIKGVNRDGKAIAKNWYLEESYKVGETFTGRAAEPDKPDIGEGVETDKLDFKFGKIQISNNLLDEDLGEQSKSRYLEELGSLKSAVAIPLNGRNKTYGVLRVINKLNGENFTGNDIRHLEFLAIHIANVLSNFRRDVQLTVFKHLSYLLIQSAYSTSNRNNSVNKVYQQVTDLLVKNSETAFKASVLRIENDETKLLEVVAVSLAPGVQQMRDDRAIKFGEGLAGKVAESRRRLILSRIQRQGHLSKFSNRDWIIENKFESFGCFPLISKERVVGTLSLYTGYNYDFYPESIEFVQSVADLVASFVHGLKLEKIEHELQQSINNISSSISSRGSVISVEGISNKFQKKEKMSYDGRLSSYYPDDFINDLSSKLSSVQDSLGGVIVTNLLLRLVSAGFVWFLLFIVAGLIWNLGVLEISFVLFLSVLYFFSELIILRHFIKTKDDRTTPAKTERRSNLNRS